MHFTLAPEALPFFHSNDYIECEDLISNDDLIALAKATKQTVANRLQTTLPSLAYTAPPDLFLAGRDTWRDDETIKRVVLRTRFAEVAAQLLKEKNLRIAYDQVLLSPAYLHLKEKNSPLPKAFNSPYALDAVSSIQGVLLALILQLSPVESAQPSPTSDLSLPLPQKRGNGTFFRPTLPFSLSHLMGSQPLNHQLLIVYSSKNSLYKREENDPHIHALKKLGYSFGDCLAQATHPLLLPR